MLKIRANICQCNFNVLLFFWECSALEWFRGSKLYKHVIFVVVENNTDLINGYRELQQKTKSKV